MPNANANTCPRNPGFEGAVRVVRQLEMKKRRIAAGLPLPDLTVPTGFS